MGSEIGRLRGQLAIVEARRQAQLENAAYYRTQAEHARAARDVPPDASRTYEHQREMDQRAERATADAERSQQQAELSLNEARGLERELAYRTRQER
jgi:flagellar biosynthesis GTPase FlhF